MSGDFFDTNVLLYLLSEDAEKADRAEALVREGGGISVQVLNEALNVMRRKLWMSWREAREFLMVVRGLLDVKPVTVETHELGLDFAERYGLSIHDSMIAAAATLNGCVRLLSQDMQHGMRIGEGLRVENPFR
jgi:predicted nucleic acid-binding protein